MRVICKTCETPTQRCICGLITAINNKINIVVLQHPNEVRHAKGTAHLLMRCLDRGHIVAAETFDPHELALHENNTALLYPASENKSQIDQSENFYAKNTTLENIVIIDSTWRKSRRLMYDNPWLALLPRLSIRSMQSRYIIRKSEKCGQLSTFESAVHGLHCIGDLNDQHVEQLLHMFDQFNQLMGRRWLTNSSY